MSDSHSAPVFLGLDAEQPSWREARAVLLPVPFERTVSYGQGTGAGPEALLEASAFVELYDEELCFEPQRVGFYTAPAIAPSDPDLADALDTIAEAAHRHLAADKFLVGLGGEHSLTQALVRATREVVRSRHDAPLGVVQFDAHADLRDEYEGTRFSHAAVMRRIVDDLGLPTVAVGIRSLSTPEAELIAARSLPTLWSHELDADARTGSTARFEAMLEHLPRHVYLTFDIDYFDPSLVPSTGTPEPGGGTWHYTMNLLRLLFARKEVVAMDVVELAPVAGQPASDFVAAKLVHKALGYRFAAARTTAEGP
ncbi:MAG: agmatinase [Acidobacteriota bacterium]